MSTAQATKERPILFSGPLVRAILAGRKTQTRRIIKPQPPVDCVYQVNGAQSAACCYCPKLDPDGNGCGNCWVPPTPRSKAHLLPCPYGQPGDHLWVRESFSTDIRDPLNCVIYKATPEYGKYRDTGEVVRSSFPDGTLPTREESQRAMLPKFWKGKPSIHMPRWASRLTLRVTGLRVEQLRDITEDDAKAEGVDAVAESYVTGFCHKWHEINGPDSWAQNPWVWVVEFERVEA